MLRTPRRGGTQPQASTNGRGNHLSPLVPPSVYLDRRNCSVANPNHREKHAPRFFGKVGQTVAAAESETTATTVTGKSLPGHLTPDEQDLIQFILRACERTNRGARHSDQHDSFSPVSPLHSEIGDDDCAAAAYKALQHYANVKLEMKRLETEVESLRKKQEKQKTFLGALKRKPKIEQSLQSALSSAIFDMERLEREKRVLSQKNVVLTEKLETMEAERKRERKESEALLAAKTDKILQLEKERIMQVAEIGYLKKQLADIEAMSVSSGSLLMDSSATSIDPSFDDSMQFPRVNHVHKSAGCGLQTPHEGKKGDQVSEEVCSEFYEDSDDEVYLPQLEVIPENAELNRFDENISNSLHREEERRNHMDEDGEEEDTEVDLEDVLRRRCETIRALKAKMEQDQVAAKVKYDTAMREKDDQIRWLQRQLVNHQENKSSIGVEKEERNVVSRTYGFEYETWESDLSVKSKVPRQQQDGSVAESTDVSAIPVDPEDPIYKSSAAFLNRIIDLNDPADESSLEGGGTPTRSFFLVGGQRSYDEEDEETTLRNEEDECMVNAIQDIQEKDAIVGPEENLYTGSTKDAILGPEENLLTGSTRKNKVFERVYMLGFYLGALGLANEHLELGLETMGILTSLSKGLIVALLASGSFFSWLSSSSSSSSDVNL